MLLLETLSCFSSWFTQTENRTDRPTDRPTNRRAMKVKTCNRTIINPETLEEHQHQHHQLQQHQYVFLGFQICILPVPSAWMFVSLQRIHVTNLYPWEFMLQPEQVEQQQQLLQYLKNTEHSTNTHFILYIYIVYAYVHIYR